MRAPLRRPAYPRLKEIKLPYARRLVCTLNDVLSSETSRTSIYASREDSLYSDDNDPNISAQFDSHNTEGSQRLQPEVSRSVTKTDEMSAALEEDNSTHARSNLLYNSDELRADERTTRLPLWVFVIFRIVRNRIGQNAL